MSHSQKSSTTRQTIAMFLQHALHYKLFVTCQFTLITIVVIISQILPPLVVARVLNRLSQGDYKVHDIWGSFGPEIVIFGVLLFLGAVIGWRVVDFFSWRLEARVQRDMAQRIFRHLLSQSANFHANHFGGSLVSQTSKLLGSYVRVADTTLYQVWPLCVSLLASAVILTPRAPLFVVCFLSFAVVFIIVSTIVSRPVRVLSSQHSAAESEQTGRLADAVTNVMAIKSFAGGKFEQERFRQVTDNTHDRLLTFGRSVQRQQLAISGLTNSISILALLFAVIGVLVLEADLATVFLIVTYTSNTAEQLWSFGNNSLRNYNRALGDAVDMVKILQTEPEIKDPVQPEPSRIRRGTIEFKKVKFTHAGASQALFKQLNLKVKSGEKIGLVGHSGSGKTTLTRILLRFSDIDKGEILIDGQNIGRITQDDLHSSIAYVPQEPIMFHRSLMENIRYGDFTASDEAIYAVAKAAHAHDFIKELPDGYETLVGERGVKLSGGQRQRIAIARAMLKNAPILVLDEATSALDSESEVLIQDALWKLMEGKTAIVIAHRLSTIQKMDRIIVMSDGQIVETGSHRELLDQKGTYTKLWKHQSGGFIEE
jgi:ATP-binding cassette subfamily B protein